MFSLGYVVDFRFIALIKRLASVPSSPTPPSLPAPLFLLPLQLRLHRRCIINNIYGYLKYLFGFLPFYGRPVSVPPVAHTHTTNFYDRIGKCAQKLKSHKLNSFL